MNQIRKNTRFYNTVEWWIFSLGLLLSILLLGAAWYLYRSDPEIVQVFSLVFAVHTIGGRAAGIGLCIINDINNLWTIVYNFYLEIIIVCFTYSISILSINNYIKLRAAKYYAIRLERKARKYKDRIEKYGWVGLFFFVMTPLPVTGPVIGSILGSLLKFKISKIFSATFTGTLTAIVLWTFFFDFLEEHLKMIRYILTAIIILVVFSYAREIKNLFTKK